MNARLWAEPSMHALIPYQGLELGGTVRHGATGGEVPTDLGGCGEGLALDAGGEGLGWDAPNPPPSPVPLRRLRRR
jgi:hypothetical protein